jgi:hypothetical protein
MSHDRILYFEQMPSRQDVQVALENYLGSAAAEPPTWVEYTLPGSGRWDVRLSATSSRALRRLNPALEGYYAEMAREPRQFEVVYMKGDHIDVLTRHADELTNAVAEGFALVVEQHWRGRRDR